MRKPLSRGLLRASASLALASALALGACGGGGGSDDEAPAAPLGDLRVDAASIVGPSPLVAGHEMRVSASVSASQGYPVVGIAFFLVNQQDRLAGVPRPRQHLLGGASIGIGAAGNIPVEAWLPVPAAITTPSDWVLIAEIDPSNVVTETDETNNSSAASVGAPALATVTPAGATLPDIVIEQLRIKPESIPLVAEEVAAASVTRPDGTVVNNIPNAIFNADVTVHVTGTTTLTNVPIGVLLDVPNYGQGPVHSGLQWMRVFHNPTQTWQNTTTIPQLVPGVPITVHLAVTWDEDPASPTGRRAAVDAALKALGGDRPAQVLVVCDPFEAIPQNEAGSTRFVRGGDPRDHWILGAVTLLRSPTDAAGFTGFSVVREWSDYKVVPWPKFLNAHTRPPVNVFLEIGPKVKIATTGNSSGLSAVVDAELHLVPFPELNPGPIPPAIQLHSDLLVNPNNPGNPYTYTFDLKFFGSTVDSATITDFSSCTNKTFAIPMPFGGKVSKDFSERWMSGEFAAEFRPSVVLGLKACASVADGLVVELTNTMSADVAASMSLGLPFLRIGPEVSVNLMTRVQTDRIQAKAALFPPSASLSYTHTVKRDHFAGSILMFVELPWFEWCTESTLGHCVDPTSRLFEAPLYKWDALLQPADVQIHKVWQFP